MSLPPFRQLARVVGAMAWLVLLMACRAVPAHEQVPLGSGPASFSDRAAEGYESRLLSAVEPGTDDRGGASASGCTSCR